MTNIIAAIIAYTIVAMLFGSIVFCIVTMLFIDDAIVDIRTRDRAKFY